MAEIPLSTLGTKSSALWSVDTVVEQLNKQLSAPAKDLFDRPKKAFRARLVQLGYEMVAGPINDQDQKSLGVASEAIEQLHAGTLIIDDIQDGSLERRAQSAIHVKYGVPQAICVGNWLYFSPIRLLSQLKLPWRQERLIHQVYHQAMEKGHFGQSLDVSTDMQSLSKEDIKSICFACMDLKTGSLTSLALQLGAIIATDCSEKINRIGEFGRQLGFALQCFDDLGNTSPERAGKKYLEDLQQRKPGFIWAIVQEEFSKSERSEFYSAVKCLPDQAPIHEWMNRTKLYEIAYKRAEIYLQNAQNYGVDCLDKEIPFFEQPQQTIEGICDEIRRAYL